MTKISTALAALAPVTATAREPVTPAHADAWLDPYLSRLAHDLRSPLAVVAGHAQLLSKLTAADEEPGRLTWSAEAILRASRRMGTIIELLVELGRLRAGTVEVVPQRVFLAELLAPLAESAADRFPGTTVELHAPREVLAVLADPERLERVVVALLAEWVARCATATVRLTAEPLSAGARLTISCDRDVFTVDEARHRLGFDAAGRQTDEMSSEWATARQLAELSGVTLSVSEDGAEVSFELPPG